jgi:hypothetical protein
MKKKYDLAVKVSTFTNKQGEQKNKWANIGAVMQNDNGFFMILDRTFNPAGVPNPEHKESLLVSMFEPNENQGGQQQAPQQSQQAPADDFGDYVPF